MRILLAGIIVLVVVGSVVMLAGCESADSSEARRLAAEANLVQVQADAHDQRVQTNIEAANARLERALIILPYIIAIGGGVLVAALGLFIFWHLNVRATQAVAEARAQEARYLAMAERYQYLPGPWRVESGQHQVVVYNERDIWRQR